MPVTIQPATLKYKDSVGSYQSADCLKGDKGDKGDPTDVQVNGTSIVSSGVANIPLANSSNFGVVKINADYGITITSANIARTSAANSDHIKAGTNAYKPIVVQKQHESVFYGLAKVAGQDMSSSANAVGTYTSEAKAAIWNMLGLDASAFVKSDWEVIKTGTATNAESGDITISTDDNNNAFELTDVIMYLEIPSQNVEVSHASSGSIDAVYGTGTYEYMRLYQGTKTVSANSTAQYSSIKIDQADGMVIGQNCKWTQRGNAMSENLYAVEGTGIGTTSGGAAHPIIMASTPITFTSLKINSFTGTINYKLYGKRKRTALDNPVVTVSGTTPTITGLAGHRYICGEVSTLSITPPQSGIVDVIFTSGTTATVLTVPNTVKFPAWFDPTDLEASKTYEISILEGTLGAVMSWQA